MCHETSGSALRPTIGIRQGTVTLEDLHDSEVVIIISESRDQCAKDDECSGKSEKNGAKL